MAGDAGDMELGEARRRFLHLANELRKLRGVPRDLVLAWVMATRLYRNVGAPKLHDMTLEQATELSRLLERWIEKERARAPAPTSNAGAPPAPWQATGRRTDEGGGAWT